MFTHSIWTSENWKAVDFLLHFALFTALPVIWKAGQKCMLINYVFHMSKKLNLAQISSKDVIHNMFLINDTYF